MELLNNLSLGFETAFTAQNLMYCFIGCVLGTLIGVLPGLGPIATIAMLLPATYALPPIAALIMLAGIYYGSQYGGSTTAILLNIPGETSSVVTAIDGYQMAKRGRGGVALFAAGMGSFFAGCVATLMLAGFAAPLAEVAFKFGPAEYFSLMVLGLIGAVVLASGSLVKAIGMILLGLLLGLIGTDVNSGVARYSFDIPQLSDGIGFVSVAMGVFGFAEIMLNLEKKGTGETFLNKVTTLIPTWTDVKRMVPSILRGTTIGSILGILPGGGAALAAFGAYTVEKKSSKYSEEFGKGAIEGVAGPEAANNANAAGVLVPMLALGLPTSATAAVVLVAFQSFNIQPGPMLFQTSPEVVWGLIASLFIGNALLLVLNLPLIRFWVLLLKIPTHYLYAGITTFALLGAYALNNSTFDLQVALAVGFIGYLFRRFGVPVTPLIIGVILGPLAELQFKRALQISQGDWNILIAGGFPKIIYGILLLVIIGPLVWNFKKKFAVKK